MRGIWVAGVLLALTGLANAQITPIPPFVGQYQEGWEAHALGQFLPHLDAFGGNADVWQVGGSQGLHVTTSWGYYFTTYPHGGSKFMGGTSQVTAKWEFDVPAAKFGGYFTTNYQSSGGTANFYDTGGNLVGTQPVQAEAGNSTWRWDGWQCNPPVKFVEISSNFGAGHIMHDDMEYTPGGGSGAGDGDLNCDGVINAFDIDAFVKCLTTGTPTPPCPDCQNADINDDGVINAFDIDPFVVCLTTGVC